MNKKTGRGRIMDKESKLAEGGLRHLGFQMKIAEKKDRNDFDQLKHKCDYREPYEPNPDFHICSGIKRTWHVWPCKMSDCPLLKGEL